MLGSSNAKSCDTALKRLSVYANLRRTKNGSTMKPESATNTMFARFDLPWSHSTIPKPESVALLVKLLEEQSKPILVHCQGGVHRTGIASAIYQLNNEVPKEVASKEVGLFFMKAPIGDFLDLYPTEDSDFGNWVIVSYPSIYEDYNEEN